MHREWLAHSLSEIGVSVKKSEEEVLGYLVGIKGRKEWKFIADASATVRDLCLELESQIKPLSIKISEAHNRKKIIDTKEEIDIVVEDTQILYLEIYSIRILPLIEEKEKREGLITLHKIGTKKRTCHLCKTGIAEYRKKIDVLICTKEKMLCAQCYKDFHWDKKGEKKYQDFSYEAKEK